MPYSITGPLNLEGKKYCLAASLQGQTCCMCKVPEGPLGAASAAEPKLVVRELKLSLKVEGETVCQNPLQHL